MALSERQRVWLGHVEACASIGCSMKAYAEDHELNLQSFYFWKGQLKKLGAVGGRPGDGAVQAVRVALCGDGAVRAPGKTCIQLTNGVTIELQSDFEPEALVALIKLAMRL